MRAAPLQIDDALDFLAALDMQTHQRIGDLYRAEHAHRPARKHFIVAWYRLSALRHGGRLTDVITDSRRAVELQVSHGKASYELGRHKEALCWHLRAWRDLLHLLAADMGYNENTDATRAAIKWLDRVRYEPEMRKSELIRYLAPVVEQLERVTISRRHGGLAGDVLLRLGHLLLVLDLGAKDADDVDRGDRDRIGSTLAAKCLRKAFECDPYSTMIITDLQKAGFRLDREYKNSPPLNTAIEPTDLPRVGQLWPRGGSDFERLARAAEYLILRGQRVGRSGVEQDDESSEKLIARELLFDFFMNTDSINVRKSQGYKRLMQEGHERHLPTGANAPAIEFICMRRYSSPFPLLPRPSAFRALGGGYFVRLHSGSGDIRIPYGIAVDPGVDFIENLYRCGYSLGDINMILVTHDHVDHAGALDSLISLLHVRRGQKSKDKKRRPQDTHRPAATDAEGADKESSAPILLALSKSMFVRYSNAALDPLEFTVMSVSDMFVTNERPRRLKDEVGLPEEFEIIHMSSKHIDGVGHRDLGGHASFGVCIRTKEPHGASVAITSDTPAPSIESDDWRSVWEPALQADVLVAHLSSVPLTELRKLSGDSQSGQKASQEPEFQKLMEDTDSLNDIGNKLKWAQADSAGEIDYGLWLRSHGGGAPADIVGPVPPSWESPTQHSFLRGILQWARAYQETRTELTPSGPGLFVVGELGEELGMMRNKIAEKINYHIFDERHVEDETDRSAHSLTGDIGLSVLITPRDCATGQVRVLCTTCNLDTDRVLEEKYHVASEMIETCVKGENEGIFYSCAEHAPNTQPDQTFLEQLERFDIFGR